MRFRINQGSNANSCYADIFVPGCGRVDCDDEVCQMATANAQ